MVDVLVPSRIIVLKIESESEEDLQLGLKLGKSGTESPRAQDLVHEGGDCLLLIEEEATVIATSEASYIGLWPAGRVLCGEKVG